jgi:hypothetical protein
VENGATLEELAATLVEAPDETPEESAEQVDEAVVDEVETAEAATDEGDAEPEEPAEPEPEAVTDDGNEEAEESQEQEPALHTVKVDGQPKLVTYDELLRGYSGQSHIQQSFEQLKTEKANLAEAAEILQAERDRLISLSEQIGDGQRLQEPTPPPRELLQSDPIGYMEAKAQYDDDLAQYEKAQSEVGSLRQQSQAQKEREHQQYLAEQMRILTEHIPEIADPEKGPAVRDKLVAAGGLYGFTDAEMRMLADARNLRVLNDAMKWQEFQAGRAQAEKKAAPLKSGPVVKPGVKKAPSGRAAEHAKAREKLRKSGSIEDALSLIYQP